MLFSYLREMFSLLISLPPTFIFSPQHLLHIGMYEQAQQALNVTPGKISHRLLGSEGEKKKTVWHIFRNLTSFPYTLMSTFFTQKALLQGLLQLDQFVLL